MWDVYECDGEHKIIIENDRDEVMDTIACPVCRNIAVYNGSVKSLKEIEKEA